jgi:hypothetical protein
MNGDEAAEVEARDRFSGGRDRFGKVPAFSDVGMSKVSWAWSPLQPDVDRAGYSERRRMACVWCSSAFWKTAVA